jgi:hypothetical protein
LQLTIRILLQILNFLSAQLGLILPHDGVEGRIDGLSGLADVSKGTVDDGDDGDEMDTLCVDAVPVVVVLCDDDGWRLAELHAKPADVITPNAVQHGTVKRRGRRGDRTDQISCTFLVELPVTT